MPEQLVHQRQKKNADENGQGDRDRNAVQDHSQGGSRGGRVLHVQDHHNKDGQAYSQGKYHGQGYCRGIAHNHNGGRSNKTAQHADNMPAYNVSGLGRQVAGHGKHDKGCCSDRGNDNRLLLDVDDHHESKQGHCSCQTLKYVMLPVPSEFGQP